MVIPQPASVGPKRTRSARVSRSSVCLCPVPFSFRGLAATAEGTRMLLNVAFNYSGRSEIVDAVRDAVSDGLSATEIDEAAVRAHPLGSRG